MPARRLYRSRVDKKLAGVCGGIAEYFEIDPALTRIAAVVLFFMHGIGLIAYLIAWLAIPWRPLGAGEAGVSGEPGPAGAPDSDTAAMPGEAAAPPLQTGSGSRSVPRNLDVIAGGLFITAGVLFLLLNLGILDWELFRFWRWRVIWPVALIGFGLYVVMTSLRSQQRMREP